MWVSKNCHWCCILKAELDQNLLNVSILINVNSLGESVPHDVQTNIYLRVSLSDVERSFHFIENVSSLVHLNTACNYVIDKYAKNQTRSMLLIYTQGLAIDGMRW